MLSKQEINYLQSPAYSQTFLAKSEDFHDAFPKTEERNKLNMTYIFKFLLQFENKMI